MGAFLQWMVARRLLTLVGFSVILLGAFVPWPNLAIAAVVIILGAGLLAVQIPIAMRDATEQLDGFDEPEEQWRSSSYATYQPPAQFQPDQYSQPEEYQPAQPVSEPAPAWQPSNIPFSPVPSALEQRLEAPLREAPAAVSQPASAAAPQQSSPSRPMYEPAPVWQPQNIPQSQQPEPQPDPSPEAGRPEPGWKVGESPPPWRPKNIPQY
jgi:hypothetical protein